MHNTPLLGLDEVHKVGAAREAHGLLPVRQLAGDVGDTNRAQTGSGGSLGNEQGCGCGIRLRIKQGHGAGWRSNLVLGRCWSRSKRSGCKWGGWRRIQGWSRRRWGQQGLGDDPAVVELVL